MTSQRTISASELVLLEKVENESAKTTLSMKDCVSQFAETSVGNSAVVVSSIMIFVIDLLAVQIADLLGFN